MADVNNKVDVRSDGSVVLYQRVNRDGSLNQIFQMRIRIPLSASKGYFRGSTGESNQGRATQVALNKFDELYNKVKDRGVGICSERQGFYTSTSMGEIMFQFVGILSSWEREMIRERTLAGLERAKSEGKTLGRRKVTNETVTAKIIELRTAKKTIRQIASEVGVSRGTVSNVLKVA